MPVNVALRVAESSPARDPPSPAFRRCRPRQRGLPGEASYRRSVGEGAASAWSRERAVPRASVATANRAKGKSVACATSQACRDEGDADSQRRFAVPGAGQGEEFPPATTWGGFLPPASAPGKRLP